VAAAALTVTLILVAFLPRKHEESHLLDDEDGGQRPSLRTELGLGSCQSDGL
jgi:hypothetical protein